LYSIDGFIYSTGGIGAYSPQKLDVDDPLSFRRVGTYLDRDKAKIYRKYSISQIAVLFEDDYNYYGWELISAKFQKFKKE
tara:strand:- start:1207 stop:1446 length:240 start_codon:yes stop_codon:yes gene_type:complete